jgi:hypothetical protein
MRCERCNRAIINTPAATIKTLMGLVDHKTQAKKPKPREAVKLEDGQLDLFAQ